MKKTANLVKAVLGITMVLALCGLAACNTFSPATSTTTVKDTPTEKVTETADITDTAGIDKALSNSILKHNSGAYLDGECQAEGHFTMDSTTDGKKSIYYMLTMYGEYGFEDGNFVKISGTGVIPTVITLSKNENGDYSLTDYKEPEDGSAYESSIKRLFPQKLWAQCLNIDEEKAKQIETQERSYAQAYLASIGREATIGEYADFQHKLLTDLGVSVQVSNTLCGSKELANYPQWVGNLERIENGNRYVYKLDYDSAAQKIIYSKFKYDTKEPAEKIVFDSVSGKELSRM